MIEVNKIPTLEELTEGVRKIKVKVPNKKTAVDEELLHMRVKGATYAPGEIIEKNDIVALKISGGFNKKYNKDKVQIAVGMNLYNKDIEDELIGMKINEDKTIAVEGEEVTFNVISIKKKIYSEITLEQAKEEDPTITSVEEYKDKIYEGICNKLIRDKAEKLQLNPIIEKLLNTADIKFNYEEVEEDLLKKHRELLKQLEESLKEEDAHDYMADFMRSMLIHGDFVKGILDEGSTKEEYVNSLNDEDLLKAYRKELDLGTRKMYIKIAFCEKNGMDLSKEAYEAMVKNQAEIYKMPVETYKEKHPYLDYRYFSIQNTLSQLLIDYMINNDFIKVIEI